MCFRHLKKQSYIQYVYCGPDMSFLLIGFKESVLIENLPKFPLSEMKPLSLSRVMKVILSNIHQSSPYFTVSTITL